MGKKVMLPLSLLEQIIVLLERWDVSDYCYKTRWDYGSILWELKVKIQKLELREAYTKMIQADDPDAKHAACMEYFQKRSQLGNVDVRDMVF